MSEHFTNPGERHSYLLLLYLFRFYEFCEREECRVRLHFSAALLMIFFELTEIIKNIIKASLLR
jgi:hypothetical protein